MNKIWAGATGAAILSTIVLAACGGGDGEPSTATQGGNAEDGQTITVYSGRAKEYAGPIFKQFEQASGTRVKVRYGDSAELSATVLEEGDNSPADVFFSQDAGALGALQKAERLAPLPASLTSAVDDRYRAADNSWVGTSGRARIVAYSTERVRPAQLPARIADFTDPRWKGRIGWAPSNSSFQAFVTAMRKTDGDQATQRWLEGIVRNEPQTFDSNSAIRDAIASGEIDVGFINHYYVVEARAEDPDYPVAIHFTRGGDPGALVNVAGVGVLEGAANPAGAEAFARFLLSPRAQHYFAQQVKEYPLVPGVKADPSLVPLAQIRQPRVDLADLDDVQGTVRLIQQSGAL